MSQLDKVLRRSIAHLDPSDQGGRDRVFASAREAMIRLLHVYDPPLTSDEIASKISEFDAITRAIEAQFILGRPAAGGLLMLEAAGAAKTRSATILPPMPRPEAPLLPDPEIDDEEEERLPDEAEEEAALEGDVYDDYEDEDPDRAYGYDDDDVGPKDRFLDMIDAIGWRPIAAAVALLVIVGIAFVWLAHGRTSEPVQSAENAAATSPAEAVPAEPQAESASSPAAAEAPAAAALQASPPAASPGQTPADGSPSGLALETLVLFDGRDPSVFQSAPENPVSFQGDAEGGFARVSSSTGSTGARVQVGRGVYQRIAGHQIRIVLVARAALTAPATSLRFAYQNGRIQSPWTDVPLTGTYTPLSAVWTAPPERGGPENDSLIIEPGIPGDDTAVDIRSVRIEILN